MTWKFDLDRSVPEMDVIDHEDAVVKTIKEPPFSTVEDVKSVMENEIVKEFKNNNMELTEYALQAMMDMANENIEEK